MKSAAYLIILAILASCSPSFVSAEENQWPSITASSLVANKYRAFGTGSLLSKNPVIQCDFCVSFNSGVYLDLWSSKSLNGSWNDGSFGNEIDYQIGWKGMVATNLSLNVGLTYFDEPAALTFGAGDIFYTHAFLTKDFKQISVTAGYENYLTMPNSKFHGGNLFSLGLSKRQSFHNDKISVRISAVGVYDTGTLGTSPGLILRGSIGTDWNITKRLTINFFGLDWYVPLTPNDRRTSDAVVYSGLTIHIN